MTIWSDTTAAAATQGKANGQWQASRVVIDSRSVKPGDLFVAIKGEKFDGHSFAAEALARGAAAIMISEKPKTVSHEAPLLLVGDTLTALEDLGRAARARSKAKIVGVTGSVGKTSTKEMIRLALSAHGKVYATSGNLNNHIGTPLSLANLPEDAEFAVLEMGMNHAGEIAQLTRQVRPHVAVITTVEAVHLEFFKNVEQIAEAKAEIFEGMEQGGVAVLGRDHACFAQLKAAAEKRGIRTVSCGEAADAEWRLAEYRGVEGGLQAMAAHGGETVAFGMKALGKHWAVTGLFALAVAEALGLDVAKTAAKLAEFSELAGRGKVARLPSGAWLMDDSYNASPASMRAAFAKVVELWEVMGKKGRKIAALGDMRELGKKTPEFHAGLAPDVVRAGFDKVFTAGSSMKYLRDALPVSLRAGHAEDAQGVLPLVRDALREGDILLVKGSHGSHMYEVAVALLNVEGKKHAV